MSGEPIPSEARARWRDALAEAGWLTPLAAESVSITEAAGRVLAAPVTAARAVPPVRVAAMDGIAVRAADTSGAPTLLAGGDFAPVDTGAPVPDGFDAVVRREQVSIDGAGAQVAAAVTAGADIRAAGEDVPVGEVLLPEGHLLSPFDVGLLAAAGHVVVDARSRPRVAVIPTGDELRTPGEPLEAHHTIDSNCPMLAAQAAADGAVPTIHPRVPDDPHRLGEEVMRAVLQNDLVLLVAGSSRGRRDHSRDVLAELGDVAVDGVAVRPGHPVLLAVVGTTPVIGVPGYPVSAAFTYELFAHPLLCELVGRPAERAALPVVLDGDIGGRDDSECMVAVRFHAGAEHQLHATPLSRRAAALHSLAQADGYVIVPPGPGLVTGSTVSAFLLRDR
ncbi:MAG: molybdopterin molybdotransferase MoeA [Gaiellales bacterium]